MSTETEAKSTQKIAVVTGGSRGLGRNTAVSLAKRGSDVILTYHANKAEADAAVAEIEALGRKALALQLDTGDIAAFDGFVAKVRQALAETWGREHFDHLVNNAGIALYSSFAETKEEDFDRLFNIHFKGVFFLTQKLLPLIKDGGRIVNVSSGLARFSLPGLSAYGSMKGAVEVLTRYLAKELGPRGIAVNVVAPGAIETDFGGGHVRDDAKTNQFVASSTAMGRAGLPDDIGPMIASLLADENRWVTGQRIEVSGGMLL
ncbi:SDR family NAD(P)-dependent oxidoreductase [Bosea caraganae]|uniref:SDR family NAD(P)-dependent oxidoreductase n=1 Tax=Bosea caraganae TaxID=2763117 RepID=A0A370LD76_9HYPH|nr:SDR family oxidoreductase [Bosea caraganae]RDJ27869.1 SDR family NAD(P)-dependent oxidoreductase [Bosea caraganae]RDJ29881.1 SDR family NAD(P)-dependent oxidoreductase [Bosea caraganae]